MFRSDCPARHGKELVIACANIDCPRAIGYSEWNKQQQPKGTNMATKKNTEPATAKEVRAWAAEKGLEVGARGRIKPDVLAEFTRITKRPVVS